MRYLKKLLAVALIASLCVLPVSAAPSDDDAERETTDAEEDLSVDDLKQEKADAEDELEDLQDDLEEVVAEIDELERELVDKGEEIAEAEEDLAVAEADEEKQYEDMKIRIAYTYEAGDMNWFEVLLSAESFSDLLNKVDYVMDVQEYDQEKLDEYTATVEKVEELKQKLEDEQAELEEKETEYQDKQDELDSMIEDKESDIEDLEEKIEEAVKKAEEEARRKREEEARAAIAESEYGNGTDQYQCDNDSEKAQTIVYAAYSQLGVPYVWGGASPGKALDCSGLVQYCLRQAGISVPHYSGDIGSGGTKVTTPEAGDVVCYSGHCAIYVGDGKMIEAPHSGAVVKVSSVRSGCWYRRYW